MSYIVLNKPLRSGKEVCEYHRMKRSDLAYDLWNVRRKMRMILPSHVCNVNEFVRKHFARELRYVPFKPTAENFRRMASERLAYADSPVPRCGNEYYSACGMEDYYGEKREYAKHEAVEYFRAWKFLIER